MMIFKKGRRRTCAPKEEMKIQKECVTVFRIWQWTHCRELRVLVDEDDRPHPVRLLLGHRDRVSSQQALAVDLRVA